MNNKAANNNTEAIERESYVRLPLVKKNFVMMGIAGAMIVVGFLLMTGAPATATEFNPDIFSARRIVVGPTLAFLGFLFMGFAIMSPGKKSSSEKSTQQTEEK